jgi:hypothetical protein
MSDTTSVLTWHRAEAPTLPDADITVLCWLEPGSEWFTGWWDGHAWLDAATGGTLDGVTHWAEPCGPEDGEPTPDAAAEERERCARIAEQQAECNGLAAGWHIAAEIRGANVKVSGAARSADSA